MSKFPLSVFIVAKNEADRIAKPILSVRDWSEEVIVVDSGSDDGTPQVAESLGAKVVFNEWKGYGHQKRFAASLCRNGWVLNLDADEEVSPELATEIQALFKGSRPPCAAYRIKISMVLPFEKRPKAFGNHVWVTRLYDRTRAESKAHANYDEVKVKGMTGTLKQPIWHRSFRSYTHQIEKINIVSSEHARALYERGRRVSAIRILAEPMLAFLRVYFLRRYCVYGMDGFIQGCIYALGRTLRLAKLRELWKAREKDGAG